MNLTNNQSDDSHYKITKLTQENILLKKDNEEFQKKFNEQFHKVTTDVFVESTVEVQKKDIVSNKYFGIPNFNGFFESNVETKESSAIYKFSFDLGNNKKAHFNLHNIDLASLNTYISALDIFINPACDKLNAPTDQTQKIEIVEPGIVHLENDVWKIEKKCKIKFI